MNTEASSLSRREPAPLRPRGFPGEHFKRSVHGVLNEKRDTGIRRSRPAVFLARKFGRYATTAALILTMNFLIPRMMPGDPLRNVLGQRAVHLSEEVLLDLRHRHGLDRPLGVQYLTYLRNMVRGDLGDSLVNRCGVAELIRRRLPGTLALMGPSTFLGALLALVAGTLAGFQRGGRADLFLTTCFTIMSCFPMAIVAMVALSVFGAELQWSPLGGYASGDSREAMRILDIAWHLALPVLVLSLFSATYVFLVVRNRVADLLQEYFVFFARSRGLSEGRIAMRHILPNALPPFIGSVALDLGSMVAGAIVIEMVFSLNGMGLLIHEAVIARDYPVIQGAFLVLTASVLTANLCAEIAYAWADPRIMDSGDGLWSV